MSRLFSVLAVVLLAFDNAYCEPITAGVVLGGAAITGAASLIGGGIQALFSLKGQKDQIKENRRAEKINLKFAQEDRKTRKEEFRLQFGEAKRGAKVAERFAEKQLAISKEERKFNRIRGMTNMFYQQMNQNTQLKNNMINLWERRAA